MPREVDGRPLPSSDPDDLEAFSRWSFSAGLRADLERDTPDGLSLTGDDGLLLELDFAGGACAPQKPQDCEPWSRTTFGRSFLVARDSSFSLWERECSLVRDFSGFSGFSGGGVGIGSSSKSRRSSAGGGGGGGGGGLSLLEEDLPEDLLDFLSLLLDDFLGAGAGGGDGASISSSCGGGGGGGIKYSSPGKPPGTGVGACETGGGGGGGELSFLSFLEDEDLVFLSLEDDFFSSTGGTSTIMGSGSSRRSGSGDLDDFFETFDLAGGSGSPCKALMRSWILEFLLDFDLGRA